MQDILTGVNNFITPTPVLDTSDLRKHLPDLVERARKEGIHAEVVFYGPYRRPDLTILHTALFKIVAPYIEDILIAESVREHRAAHDDDGISIEQLMVSLDVTDDDVEKVRQSGIAATFVD